MTTRHYSFWPYKQKSGKYIPADISEVYTTQKDAIIGACMYVLANKTRDADVLECMKDNPNTGINRHAIAKIHYNKRLGTVTYIKFTADGKREGFYEYRNGRLVKLRYPVVNIIDRLVG